MTMNKVLLKMMENEEFSVEDISNCIRAFIYEQNELGLSEEEQKTFDKLMAIDEFVKTVGQVRNMASDL